MPLTPEEIRDYLLGELSPAERADFESRLRADPAACDELRRQRAVIEALRNLPEEDMPRRVTLVPARRRFRPPPRARRLAALAVLAALAGIALWASRPAVTRYEGGWAISFGSRPPSAPQLSRQELLRMVREEIERGESRWRQALAGPSQAAAGGEWARSEFAAVRRELEAVHDDALAGFQFVNAKHELLKRQLLEFQVAGVAEARP